MNVRNIVWALTLNKSNSLNLIQDILQENKLRLILECCTKRSIKYFKQIIE